MKEKSHKPAKKKSTKMSVVGEFWVFLRVRKKYWLLPVVIFLMLLGTLIVLTEGTAIAPFIYALF